VSEVSEKDKGLKCDSLDGQTSNSGSKGIVDKSNRFSVLIEEDDSLLHQTMSSWNRSGGGRVNGW